MKTITLFGSSAPRDGSKEYTFAFDVGSALARAGFVICNGGFGGTMEAAARGAKEAGGTTIGVTVDVFKRKANDWIDREIREQTLADRLSRLIELGDGYVVFPGSTGTLLELAAVWEFMNKGVIREKPILVLGTFWKPIIEQMKEIPLQEGMKDCTKLITYIGTAR